MLNIDSKRRALLLLLLMAGVFLFAGLGRVDLRGSTEPREAGIAAYMLLSNDYLTPRLNGRPFLEKPPLSYWLQAASMTIFGNQSFAPRIPSALAGMGTVLLLFFLAQPLVRRSANDTVAQLLPGLLLLTENAFWMTARTAGQDTLLAFGVTLALLAYFLAQETGRRRDWLLFALGLAIAVMTKGVVGLAIPAIIVFVFLLHTHFTRQATGWRAWALPCAYGALGLLPLGIWLLALFDAHGIAAVKEILIANSVGRFQGNYAQDAHAEPVYYYLAILPATFQPWLYLFFVAIVSTWKNKGNATASVDKSAASTAFLFCWIFAAYALLTVSSGKRPSYLIMIYPAVALLIGDLINNAYSRAAAGKLSKPFFITALVHLCVFAGAAIYLTFKIGKVGSVFTGFGYAVASTILLMLSLYLLRRRSQWFVVTTAAWLLTSYTAYYGAVLPPAETGKSMHAVMDKLAAYRHSARRIALYKPMERTEGAVAFYLGEKIPVAETPAALEALFAQAPAAVVLAARTDPDIANLRVLDTIRYSDEDYVYVSSQ